MKRYFCLLFLIVTTQQGLTDNPAPKDVFSARIESEQWVQSHILKGMSRADVLKLVGRPSMEETSSTGAWIMSYLLKDPPYPTKELSAYGGFEVVLQNNKVVRVDTVLRSVQPSPGVAPSS